MSVKSRYHKRKIFKTISWRIVATTTTMSIVFMFTGKITLSIGVGIVEIILKMLFYYVHEHAWDRISYGKSDHPLSDLLLKKEITPKDKEIIAQKLRELGYM